MTANDGRPVIAVIPTTDEYQRRLLRGAHAVLAARGTPLIAHCDGSFVRGASSRLLVELIDTCDPAGILCVNALDEDDQQRLLGLVAEVDLPAVHVGQRVPGSAWVRGDNRFGMQGLVAHLLDARGVRNPVLVRGAAHHPDSIERERCLREGMAARGLEFDEELVLDGNWVPNPTAVALRELLSRRRDMDAVVALSDQMACSAISVLLGLGIRVPEDVVVTGFDDAPAAANWPGLTTVDQGLQLQGEHAASLLLQRIEGTTGEASVIVPSKLVVRGSTAPKGRPAVTDLAQANQMGHSQRELLASQDAIVEMGQALDRCWTVDDIGDVLATHLPQLGVVRAFLAVYTRVLDDAGDAGLSVRVSADQAQLVLDLRDGEWHEPPADAYPSARLLPDRIRDELRRGLWILQPLEVLDRPVGFIVLEQPGGSDRLSELIRSDLSRALEGVLTARETEARTALLERVVARRTQELQAEVATRRRAERELEAANEELQRSAMLDGLTQIANRAAFQRHLAHHHADQAVAGEPLALLMIDVDGFKAFNDHYGHVVGDEALRTVASCLDRATWGSQDLACRYGGEEFAVVLPCSGVEGAVAVAQRFQRLLLDAAVPHATSSVSSLLTASIGVAAAIPDAAADPQLLVEAADRAMYEAKSLGRDRIRVATLLAATDQPRTVRMSSTSSQVSSVSTTPMNAV